MRDFIQDLRVAARGLRHSPGFTALVVLTLALGIAANAAIFSLLDAVLLRPLPVPAPERLVLLSDGLAHGVTADVIGPGRVGALSHPLFDELRRSDEVRAVFTDLAAHQTERTRAVVRWTRAPQADHTAAARLVSASFFAVLGVGAAHGRVFDGSEDRVPGASPVVVLSHTYWQRRLGGDPAAVGSRLIINGQSYDVIGILPAHFTGLRVGDESDVWVPLGMRAALTHAPERVDGRRYWWLIGIGRLAPGVTMAQAEGGVDRVLRRYLAADADVRPEVAARIFLRFEPGGQGRSGVRADLRGPLLVLMAGVGLLFVIVCLNVSHLLLARAVRRQREMSIRAALGATRARLLRQLLVEGACLAALGAVGGLVGARWLIDGLVALAPIGQVHVPLDGRILAFITVLSAAATLFFGLLPAWHTARGNLHDGMRATATAALGGRRRLAPIILGSQVAFSMVLLVGAGLLAGTLARLRAQQTGFDGERVLQTQLMLREAGFDLDRAQAFYARTIERLRALPGVRAASFSHGTGRLMRAATWRSDVLAGTTRVKSSVLATVTPGYFETLGIPVLRGRDFARTDGAGAPLVAVVNQTFARRAYGTIDAAVGQRLRFGDGDAKSYEIVAVVGDARTMALRAPPVPAMYRPVAQEPEFLWSLEVRAAGDPGRLAQDIRAAVAAVAPGLPVQEPKLLAEHVARSLGQERLLALLSMGFGLTALFLVCIGLYGVVAQWAAQRTREIGVRVALGATAASVHWLVLRRGLALVITGLLLGVPAAIVVARTMDSLLYGISAADPVTLAAAVLAMLAVTALAAYLPARRAAGVDPVVALRAE